MCPGLCIAFRTKGRFFTIWPDILTFGRITSNVVTCMSVAHSVSGCARSYTRIIGDWKLGSYLNISQYPVIYHYLRTTAL